MNSSANIWIDALEKQIISIAIGGCTCNTMSPDLSFHEPTCHYLQANNALGMLEELRDELSGTNKSSTDNLSADRDRLIHILVAHYDMDRNKAEEAADLFLHDRPSCLAGQMAWECKDYADGWIRYENLTDALAYQAETSCAMRPIRA